METKQDVDVDTLSTNHVSMKHNVDMTEITGGDGPWQHRIFLIICVLYMPCAFNIFSMSFLAPNIDHWCARPPEARNLSVEQWRTLAVPPYDKHCSRYEHINITHPLQNRTNNSEDAAIRCKTWEYDMTFYRSTVLNKFDLVCDRKWLVSLSKSVYIAGMSVSLILFSYMSDKIGRKSVIIISGLLTSMSSIICAFSTTFVTFLTARFFIALGTSALFTTPFVLLMEIVSPKYRYIYGIGVEFGWSIAFVTLPLIAWLLRDAFWIQMATTSPCVMLLALPWIPESPRWLLSQGKKDEAKEILLTAAKINGVTHSDEHKDVLRAILNKGTEVYNSGSSKVNILDLFKTSGLWQITSNLYFDWFVIAFIYYGLSLNTNELAGDPFVNFALSGFAELLAYTLGIFIVRSLGRRKTLVASMIISGFACFAAYLSPSDLWWLITTITVMGKLSISIAFATIYLFSNELFPTVVRNIGMGSASVCSSLGSVIAPFMRELGNATHPVFPQIIFGILSIASAFLVSLLPETQNCIVPDTMQEAAQSSSGFKATATSVAMNGVKFLLREGVYFLRLLLPFLTAWLASKLTTKSKMSSGKLTKILQRRSAEANF